MARKWMPASADPAEFDRQFAEARQAGSEAAAAGPAAASAAFDAHARTVTVHLRNGVSFAFPVAHFPELAGLSDAELQTVRATASGHGLHWGDADIHLAVPWLVAHLFGPHATDDAGRQGGKRRPEIKATAGSANGQANRKSPVQAEAGRTPEALQNMGRSPGLAIMEALASGDTPRIPPSGRARAAVA